MGTPQSPLTASGEPALTDREELETNLIRALIASYFSIVRQTIQDLVPKAIMHLLVNFSRESVQNRLVANLYKEGLFDELLHEDEALTAERTRIKNLLQAYKEAFQVRSLDCGAFVDGVSLTCSSELQTLSEVL